jgi:hypothetical protein
MATFAMMVESRAWRSERLNITLWLDIAHPMFHANDNTTNILLLSSISV